MYLKGMIATLIAAVIMSGLFVLIFLTGMTAAKFPGFTVTDVIFGCILVVCVPVMIIFGPETCYELDYLEEKDLLPQSWRKASTLVLIYLAIYAVFAGLSLLALANLGFINMFETLVLLIFAAFTTSRFLLKDLAVFLKRREEPAEAGTKEPVYGPYSESFVVGLITAVIIIAVYLSHGGSAIGEIAYIFFMTMAVNLLIIAPFIGYLIEASYRRPSVSTLPLPERGMKLLICLIINAVTLALIPVFKTSDVEILNLAPALWALIGGTLAGNGAYYLYRRRMREND